MRTHRIIPPLALLCLSLTTSVLVAQPSTPAVAPDARVRIWAGSRAAGHEGTVVAIDTGAAGILVWRRAAIVSGTQAITEVTDTIPLAAIERLDVYQQRRNHAGSVAGVLLWTVGGAVGGALGGALLAGALQGSCSAVQCVAGPLLGAVVGGVVGLVVGLSRGRWETGRWVSVAVPGAGG